MRHCDFYVGLDFYTATGRWRCTDVGTRVIVAIRLDAPDDSWYHGPPYAVAESVLDEIVIRMFYKEHEPAHFHAEHAGQRAKCDFSGEVIAGEIRSRKARERIVSGRNCTAASSKRTGRK
jgi:hypothetical protein